MTDELAVARRSPVPAASEVLPSPALAQEGAACPPGHFLNPPELFDATAHGYSHVALVPPGTRLVLVAGQTGHRADGTLNSDFEPQLAQALDNVAVALTASGAGLEHVVRTTMLVANYEELMLATIVEQVKQRWSAPQPPLTLIPVPTLALAGMRVEIEVMAALPA